jgi:murein hydrolase activator
VFFVPESIFKRVLIISLCIAWIGFFPGFAAAVSSVIGVVNVDDLNFRPEATLAKPAIASLNKGDRVVILQSRNGWIKAVWQGRVGYIRDMNGFVSPETPPDEKGGADLNSLKKAADTVGEQIVDGEAKILELSHKEKKIINGLNEIHLVLSSVQKKMADLEKMAVEMESDIMETSASITDVRKKIGIYKKYAGQRLVALYKLQKLGGMPHVLTSADSMYDMFKRKTIFERVLARDQAVLAGYANDAKRLRALLKQQKEQKKEKKVLDAELDDQLRIVKKEKGKEEKLLAHIRSEKHLELAVIESLRRAAVSLDERIGKYTALPGTPDETPTGNAKPFVSLKGLLKMPVRGKVMTLFGPYTDPKYNVKNFRSGIDIRTDRGEPVHAVCGGKVLYAEWFKGYGNMVIIDHGGHFYTVYANMEEIFKTCGSVVKTGEVIATAGDSGSLSGPKLYFEIRHHGKPQDPLKWIKRG